MQVAQMRLTTSSRRLLGLKAHSASPLLVHIVVSWQLDAQANIHEYIYIYIIIIVIVIIITSSTAQGGGGSFRIGNL